MIWNSIQMRYLLFNGSLRGFHNYFFSHNIIYHKFYLNKFLRATISGTSSTCKELNVVKDSSDPIIKKYRDMLLNLSNEVDPTTEDAVYVTNFGSVRFDTDNCLASEQSEDKFDSDNRKETDQTEHLIDSHNNFASKEDEPHFTNGKNLNTSDTQTFNYFDEIYFENGGFEFGNLSLKRKKLSKSKVNLEKFKITADLNYIDFQYLIDPDLNASNVHKPIQNYLGISASDTLDLNYLDSIYFGQAVETEINKEKGDDNWESSKPLKINNDDNSMKRSKEDENEDNICLETSWIKSSQSANNTPLFSFEQSLEETFETSVTSERHFVTNSTFKQTSVNRGALEEQLFDLSESVNENLTKNNPHLTDFAKESRTENETSSEVPISKENADAVKDASKPFGTNVETEKIKSAYDYVMEKRKEEHKNIFEQVEDVSPNEKFKKILSCVPKHSQLTQHEMVRHLANSILYNKDDVVALSKPYGIPMHKGPKNSGKHRFTIVDLLPHLAELKKENQLIPCHRLDMNTTGVLLLAKTAAKAEELKSMFKEHKIRKTYIAITKGAPSVLNGLIDIPIGEGSIQGIQRMALYPDGPEFKVRSAKAKKALTRYKVLSRANSCALLEVNPITGVKHQVRIHLAFGLACPVLADHKYSFLTKLAPQKLPGDALEKLGMRQSLVRHLPFHLHALSVSIPGAGTDGREIFIKASPPKFFKASIEVLQLNKRRNRLTNDHSEVIYGYQ